MTNTTEKPWFQDLSDEEIADLFDQILRELYIRAHNRSHDEEEAA